MQSWGESSGNLCPSFNEIFLSCFVWPEVK